MPEANLTGLQAFHFFLIAIALPLQYFLVEWTGTIDESARVHLTQKYVSSVQNYIKSWFSPSAWKQWTFTLWKDNIFNWLTQAIKNNTQPISRKQAEESLAKEVLIYRDPTGSFASSLKPRSPRPPIIKFRVGQVIKHRLYGYRGVIVGWDTTCRAPVHWMEANHGPKYKHFQNMPHYAVLVDSRDRPAVESTYVAEENLEVVTNTKVMNPEIDDYFDFFDGAQYHMRPAVKQLYPYD